MDSSDFLSGRGPRPGSRVLADPTPGRRAPESVMAGRRPPVLQGNRRPTQLSLFDSHGHHGDPIDIPETGEAFGDDSRAAVPPDESIGSGG